MSDSEHPNPSEQADAESRSAAESPQPEPAKTDHPTGVDQAAENQETESPA